MTFEIGDEMFRNATAFLTHVRVYLGGRESAYRFLPIAELKAERKWRKFDAEFCKWYHIYVRSDRDDPDRRRAFGKICSFYEHITDIKTEAAHETMEAKRFLRGYLKEPKGVKFPRGIRWHLFYDRFVRELTTEEIVNRYRNYYIKELVGLSWKREDAKRRHKARPDSTDYRSRVLEARPLLLHANGYELRRIFFGRWPFWTCPFCGEYQPYRTCIPKLVAEHLKYTTHSGQIELVENPALAVDVATEYFNSAFERTFSKLPRVKK